MTALPLSPRSRQPKARRNPIVLACLGLALATCAAAQTVNPSLLEGLKWRNVGPFRGGRISAVSAPIGQDGVYYAGTPMGGVWKTTDAGITWNPIFDSVKGVSSIGAVAVAPSDPNIIYVGTGDQWGNPRGNGVYKSIDAGKTWTHIGLDNSMQIPSILVDPKDPNIVLVCAQGTTAKASEDRGLYRSTDGGKTWTKTLYVSDSIGLQKITWAADNPSVMLATTDQRFFSGGAPRRGPGGPPAPKPGESGTRLFKSTDEGVTWTQITSKSLPPLEGRTCVAIAMGTNSQRMFIVENSGLYRSDDGGATWRQMDKEDPRVRNGQGGYNCGVYVNTQDPNTVYVINTCSYISKDGGETFTGFKGAPGGDDPQQMWLDPTNGNRIFLGMDQGATISLNGGKTWSLWYNQPTGQIYHIAVDNRWPYWIYGTEQDSGSIATSSRGNLGEVTPFDWMTHPGFEWGYIAADPLNGNVSYTASGFVGITKTWLPTQQWINVSPDVNPKSGLRTQSNQPLVFSESNPHELLAGFQMVMASTDGGMHWHPLSPDLTHPKGWKPPEPPAKGTKPVKPAKPKPAAEMEDTYSTMQAGDPEMMENDQRFFGGASLNVIATSSVSNGVIWVGTTDGLIKVTQNHGKTWDDVSIPKMPKGGISAIDTSHFKAGTAYVAVGDAGGDDLPHFYRTLDFGKTWVPINKGLPTDIPSGNFGNVIRADTKKDGLLFCGTESSVYVSFDNGDNWQSLALNLPDTSYRDMVVHGDDLVVCTYGRGEWILDDMSPLRQMDAAEKATGPYLFKPGTAVRVRRNVGQDTPLPPEVPHALNPPLGAAIYYNLPADATGRVTLTITDEKGNVVRTMTSDPIPVTKEYPPEPNFWLAKPEPLPTTAGMHQVDWNLRYDSPPALSHSYEINANPGQTPPNPQGPLVLPGTYTVTLSVNGQTMSQTVKVINDPRVTTSYGALAAMHTLEMTAYSGDQIAYRGYQDVNAVRDQLADMVKTSKDADVVKAAKALDAKLALIGGENGGGFEMYFRPATPPEPTFGEMITSFVRTLMTLAPGDIAPTPVMKDAVEAGMARLVSAEKRWKDAKAKDIPAFDAMLKTKGLPALK